MSEVELKGIPTFRILDYDVAMEYYQQGLGFVVNWEHRFGEDTPVYMQISKDGLILHLSENERFKVGAIVFVESKGLNELHKSLNERNIIDLFSDLETTNWGTLQLELRDPFGNLLRFNENIEVSK